MQSQPSDVVGPVVFTMLLAAPLALAISLAGLRWFLAAVKRSVKSRPERAAAVSPSSAPTRPEIPLGFAAVRGGGGGLPGAPAALVYLVGGLAFAFATAAAYLASGGLEFLPRRYLFVSLLFLWPTMLAVGLVLATSWRGWALLGAAYAAFAFTVVGPMLGDMVSAPEVVLAWAAVNGPATVLLAFFLARPVRAVGPMALVLAIAIVGGATMAMNVLGASEANMRAAAALASASGIGAYGIVAAVVVVGAVALGLVGWLLVAAIGALSKARLVTDQTLAVDSAFLVFALSYAIDLGSPKPVYAIAPFAAFAGFKIVTAIGFALARPRDRRPPPKLLLLRVFSLGKRSERLFDAFAKLWRRRGSIRMIAGPDLAASTVESHEFIEFVSGRLSRRFVADEAALESRLAESDEKRAFDGRCGVLELFCYDDTWKMALRRLVADSDAVLMDLRGYGPANQGCAFEIDALLELAPLSRVTFVVDKTTDRMFLEESFSRGWDKAGGGVNAADPAPTVRLFEMDRADARALLGAISLASD